MIYRNIFKRLFDFLFASVALLFIIPLCIIVSVLIKLDSKGPIFFKQHRLGKNGSIFRILKFRTMYHKKRKTKNEVFLDNEEITRIGKILRRLKIDELPQILNVLVGEMSIVGPRPALASQLNELTDLGKERLLVKPGLTGYAQINGNIYISWDKRWEYDKYYVANISFLFDLKIILKTVSIILFGEKYYLKDYKK